MRDEAEKARIIRQAFEWQRAAERRRIRKAIRYAIAAEEAKWDALLRARDAGSGDEAQRARGAGDEDRPPLRAGEGPPVTLLATPATNQGKEHQGMIHRQQQLSLPAAWPVRTTPPTPAERETAAQAARVQRRAEAEQLAGRLAVEVRDAVGVDALAQHVDVDRSNVYAQARGTRPPQLATFLAAIRFDPAFGHAALSSLAGEIGCVLVRREDQRPRRPVAVLLRELHAAIEAEGVMAGSDEEQPLAAAG